MSSYIRNGIAQFTVVVEHTRAAKISYNTKRCMEPSYGETPPEPICAQMSAIFGPPRGARQSELHCCAPCGCPARPYSPILGIAGRSTELSRDSALAATGNASPPRVGAFGARWRPGGEFDGQPRSQIAAARRGVRIALLRR